MMKKTTKKTKPKDGPNRPQFIVRMDPNDLMTKSIQNGLDYAKKKYGIKANSRAAVSIITTYEALDNECKDLRTKCKAMIEYITEFHRAGNKAEFFANKLKEIISGKNTPFDLKLNDPDDDPDDDDPDWGDDFDDDDPDWGDD